MSRKAKLAECYAELPNVMSLCPYFLSGLLECEIQLILILPPTTTQCNSVSSVLSSKFPTYTWDASHHDYVKRNYNNFTIIQTSLL